MRKLYGQLTAVCGIILLSGLSAVAQPLVEEDSMPPRIIRNHFRHESLIISDNDNYVLQLRDGYYTNGLMLRFSHAAAAKPGGNRLAKAVHSYELGQHIFNPVRFDSLNIATQDRPFAGYLYGRFSRQLFYKHNAYLQLSGSLGVVGPASGAKQVQRWYHSAIGIYDVQGWSNQVKNEFHVQGSVQYVRSFWQKAQQQRRYDIATVTEANLGNAFVNAQAGLLLRAGLMEAYQNSAHFNGRVSRKGADAPVHHKEFYYFVQPTLQWQGYNASLQGGMLRSNKGPKTVAIEPWVWQVQTGFKLAQNRWTLGMHYVYRSKQAVGQQRTEKFLSIQIAYRTGGY